MLTFQVEADVAARDGGDDAAYDLCGTFTADELVKALTDTFTSTVKNMLRRGGRDPVGHVLTIRVWDAE